MNARVLTAYHEAGHAVMSASIANTPKHVTIRADGHTLGRSGARMSVRPTTRVQVHLAGPAAEHLLTGRRPRQIDQEVGFAIIARIDPDLQSAFAGMDEREGYRAVEEVLRMGVSGGDDEIKSEIDRFYEIARASLVTVWQAVDEVAKALLEREELDRDAIDAILGEFDLFTPVVTVQQAHGLLTTPAMEPLGSGDVSDR